MTKIRSPDGRAIILYDETLSGKTTVTHDWFDPAYWETQGEIDAAPAGRGSAWMIKGAHGEFVLRHYLRGGLPGKFIRDRYLWTGEAQSRPFHETALLDHLVSAGLPVPRVMAARVERDRFLTYRGQILLTRCEGQPLSALLAEDIAFDCWKEIGRIIALMHRRLVWHADLNAHNILVQEANVSLVDFDRARIMSGPGSWRDNNIRRLRRSLTKILGEPLEATQHLVGWQAMVNTYRVSVSD